MANLETIYGEDAAQALYMWRFAGVSFGLEARLGGRRDRRSPPALAGIDEVTREAVASAIGYGGSGSGDRLPDAPRRLQCLLASSVLQVARSRDLYETRPSLDCR